MESEIPDFPNYFVSTTGDIVNWHGQVLTPMVNQHQNRFVGLYHRGVKFNKAVAPLVAEAFLPPHSNPTFNSLIHLDGDKGNCAVDNLMWRPRWFAIRYHSQFRIEDPLIDQKIVDIKEGVEYNDSRHAAVSNGIIESEIVTAIYDNTFVWPTYQRFALH